MTTITPTTPLAFQEALAATDGVVLVDFTAEWCAPCKMIAPILDQLDAEHDDLTVLTVDVDETPALAAAYGVMSMPTLMFFTAGRPVHRVVGARGIGPIRAALDAAAGQRRHGILTRRRRLQGVVDASTTHFSIGELAAAAGVGVETIRFYERRGILPEPARTASGYRVYAAADRWRLDFIRRAKTLGFTLKEIAALLGAGESRSVEDVRHVAEHRLVEVEAELNDLTRRRALLRDLVATCTVDPGAACLDLGASPD